MNFTKYQKTKHLPSSPGMQNDDTKLSDISHFYGKNVVITEKMDGENTSLYSNGLHARSMSSGVHPSRTWVRALHGSLSYMIPDNMRICGENLYAVHSIEYTSLPSYFMVFAVYQNDYCLSWEDTEGVASVFNLKTAPVLYKGIFPDNIESFHTGISKCGGQQEGFVVRLADSFPANEKHWIAKYVRKNHVQTSEHWLTQALRVNGLRPYGD